MNNALASALKAQRRSVTRFHRATKQWNNPLNISAIYFIWGLGFKFVPDDYWIYVVLYLIPLVVLEAVRQRLIGIQRRMVAKIRHGQNCVMQAIGDQGVLYSSDDSDE